MIDEKEIALQLTLKYLEICNPFDAPRHTPLSAEELENDSKKISGIYNGRLLPVVSILIPSE